MKRTLLNGAIALMLAGAIASCQESTFDTVPSPSIDGISLTSVDDPDPYIGTENQLTTSDAGKVARLFFKGNSDSRASSDVTVKNVVTIQDSEGNPAIYAVNLDDGYLLVSATKSYYPILAQVDHGTFSLDDTPSGRDVVIQDIVADIETSKDSVTDCSLIWKLYEKPRKPQKEAISRASLDYGSEFDRFTDYWYGYGYNIYYLTECKDILPSSVYDEFLSYVSYEDPWEGTQYSYEHTAMVIEKVNNPLVQPLKGPYLKTTWNQKAPYNGYEYPLYGYDDSPALGCVTIAVGQLMRYFEYPQDYDWSSMPNSLSYYESSTTLSSFLNKLKVELKVDANGGSNIYNAQTALKNYGYSCQIVSHSTSAIETSLNKGYPTYARGVGQGVGHAWAIDGYKKNSYFLEYRVFRLEGTQAPKFAYDEVGDWTKQLRDSETFYHMNWGWGGLNDGWYIDNNFSYTTDRMELIINGY